MLVLLKVGVSLMARKAKKRGVKPGTKRGSYKTAKQIQDRLDKLAAMDKAMNYKPDTNSTKKEFVVTSVGANSFKVGDIVSFDSAPVSSLSLVETLDAAIARLEVAIGNSTDRINLLVGKF